MGAGSQMIGTGRHMGAGMRGTGGHMGEGVIGTGRDDRDRQAYGGRSSGHILCMGSQ